MRSNWGLRLETPFVNQTYQWLWLCAKSSLRTSWPRSEVVFGSCSDRQTVKGPPRQQWRHFTHRHAWKNLSDLRTRYDNTDQQNKQLNGARRKCLSCRSTGPRTLKHPWPEKRACMKLNQLFPKHSPPARVKLQCGFRAFAQGFLRFSDGSWCPMQHSAQSLRPFGCVASTVSWSALSRKIHHKSILKRKWFSEFMAQLF